MALGLASFFHFHLTLLPVASLFRVFHRGLGAKLGGLPGCVRCKAREKHAIAYVAVMIISEAAWFCAGRVAYLRMVTGGMGMLDMGYCKSSSIGNEVLGIPPPL